eukprot:3871091-Rhodomonas_salina.1
MCIRDTLGPLSNQKATPLSAPPPPRFSLSPPPLLRALHCSCVKRGQERRQEREREEGADAGSVGGGRGC